MLTAGTVKLSREGLKGQPISTPGKEDIRADILHLYPPSIAKNGLRQNLNSSRTGGSAAPILSLSLDGLRRA
eukprot:1117942-Pleurochrysis_carterae.AAC.1